MKKSALMRYLRHKGVIIIREGRSHTIVTYNGLKTQIPRHQEIADELARKICKDLELPFVR